MRTVNIIKDDVVALLAWAIETQRKSPRQFYRDYYGGYVQAIKDVLSMIGETSQFIEKSEDEDDTKN